MEVEPGDTLFGLYQGTPLPERGWGYGNALPDRISIYQRPDRGGLRETKTRSATVSRRRSSTSSATTSA